MINKYLNDLFDANSFTLQHIQWDNMETTTYSNEKSETYILLYASEISKELPDVVFNLCANDLYKTEKLTQAQKSNLSIIVVVDVNNDLTDLQKNIVFKIEESDLYYKKFVLWYSEEELKCFNEIVGDCITSYSLNKTLVDKNLFDIYKKNQADNKGYALLSRIYIKLPFLTLNELNVLNKTLSVYVKETLVNLNEQLFDVITSHFDDDNLLDDSISLIELSECEISKINDDLRKLVETNG